MCDLLKKMGRGWIVRIGEDIGEDFGLFKQYFLYLFY